MSRIKLLSKFNGFIVESCENMNDIIINKLKREVAENNKTNAEVNA